MGFNSGFKGLNAELNPICRLLAVLGAHHILHVSRIRVNNNKPVHVSSSLAAHYQEDQLCIESSWYSHVLC